MSLEAFLNKEVRERERLERQFNEPELLGLNGDQIAVVDVAPEKLKSELPTIVTPGFSATPRAVKDLILKVAESGRRVLSAYAPHGVTPQENVTALPEAEARKLATLLSLMATKKLERVNVIANSEAAIYVAAAAAKFPERFANLVLIEPAGIIGEDSFLALLRRNFDDMRTQIEKAPAYTPNRYPSPLSVGAASILSNIPASIREIRAIAQSDITEPLRKAHDAGVGISIIHAVDDKLFPMDRVLQMVKANMLDGFYSVEGTHNSIYLFEPFGSAAEAALTALEHRHDPN